MCVGTAVLQVPGAEAALGDHEAALPAQLRLSREPGWYTRDTRLEHIVVTAASTLLLHPLDCSHAGDRVISACIPECGLLRIRLRVEPLTGWSNLKV